MIHLTILSIILSASYVSSLTCYNGMKMLSMQSVGQSTEECSSSSAYCYNMTTSSMMVIDVVKAGCSTWRCKLSPDRCISTYIQLMPVSLCCCSSDRCNVRENGIGWSDSSSSGSGSSNSNFGRQNSNNGNQNSGNNNNNNNNDNNDNSWSTSWSQKDGKSGSGGGGGGGSNQKWSPKEVEDHFNSFDVDKKNPGETGDGVEEEFVKMDHFSTTPSTRGTRGRSTSSSSSSSTGGNRAGSEIDIP